MKKASNLSPRSCPNCGAPVRNGECEYCGTVFYTAKDTDTEKAGRRETGEKEKNPLLAVVTSEPIINYRRW